MQRNSSSTKKSLHRHTTPKKPTSAIEHKLQSIRKQIEMQYHKNKEILTTKQKQNPKKSILETKKLKKAIEQNQQERFRQKYSRLEEEYMQEKKQFLITIQRFNSLKSLIEAYFRSPMNQGYIKKFREFYLNQDVEIYMQKVLSLSEQNQSLKNHVQKMLQIFQMNDFQQMFKSMSQITISKHNNNKTNQSDQVQNLRKDLFQRGKQIQNILSKLIKYQHQIDLFRQQSQRTNQTIHQLQTLNTKLQKSQQLLQYQFQQLEKQNQILIKQNNQFRVQIQNLKSIADRLGQQIAELQQQRELIKTSIDDKIDQQNRVQSLINQNNSLMYELNDVKRQFNHLKQDTDKQVNRQRDKKNDGIVRDVLEKLGCQQRELNGRIKVLISCQEQVKISNGLVEEFSKNIENLMEQIEEYKDRLSNISLQRDEYKFLLNNLNKQIEEIRREQKQKANCQIQKEQIVFKKSAKQMNSRHETLLRQIEQYKHEIQFYKKNQKLSNDIQTFQIQNRQLLLSNTHLKLQIESLSSSLQQLQYQSSITISSLQTLTKTSTKQIQTLKKLLSQSNSHRQQSLLQLQTTKLQQQTRIQILQQQLRLSQSNVHLRDQQLSFKSRQYQIQLHLLTQKISSLQTLSTQSSNTLHKINQQYQHLKLQKMKLQQQNKQHLQHSSQISSYQQTINKLSNNLTSKQNTINQLNKEHKQNITTYQQQITNLQQNHNKQLKSIQNQFQKDKQKLISDYQKIINTNSQNNNKLLSQQHQKQQIQKQQIIKQLYQQIDRIKSKQSGEQKIVEQLKEQCTRLKYENIDKDNLLAEFEDINAGLNIKVREEECLVKEKSKHIKDMNLQLTAFRDEMEVLIEENKGYKKEITKQREEIEELKKYIEGERERMKEVVRVLGEDQDCEEISRFEEIKQVYKNGLNSNKDQNLNKFKKNLLQLSIVQGPKPRQIQPISPCSSISKDFNFKHNIQQDSQQLKTQNQNLKSQIKTLQKKITKLQNDQNITTLKAMITKFFDALLTQDNKKQAQLLQSTRIILKVLDFSNNSREDILTRMTNIRKKKNGFFSFLK